MERDAKTQKRILHRFKITQGHLKKVIEMTEKQHYCIDILHQSQAVQRALREIDNLLMENHLQTCVAESVRKGDESIAINEVMSIFKRITT